MNLREWLYERNDFHIYKNGFNVGDYIYVSKELITLDYYYYGMDLNSIFHPKKYEPGMKKYKIVMIDKLNGIYYIRDRNRDVMKDFQDVHCYYSKAPPMWEVSYER